jgi:hypothetical protein
MAAFKRNEHWEGTEQRLGHRTMNGEDRRKRGGCDRTDLEERASRHQQGG